MYIYACVYVFVHLCVYTRVYAYVYAYLCIDCGSWYQYFSVWTVSCMRMCFRVNMHAYTYVCRYIYMCICFAVSATCTLQVLWALVHGRVCMLHQHTQLRHTRCRLCTYVYTYICVYMHLYAYGCVCASMILLNTLRRCY